MPCCDKARAARSVTLGMGMVAAGAAGMAYAVRAPRSDLFGPSVWRGPADRAAIALTFDDGPSESTPEILEVLDRHRARATFFQCGLNVRRVPDVSRQVFAAGHEIGNHSYTHLLLAMRSAGLIEEEFARAQEIIAETTGASPWLMRAPFGARWFGFRRAQRRLGLLGVMWSVLGYDWKRSSRAVVDKVKAGIANGAIICLHDGRQLQPRPDIRATLEAVRVLVPLIQDQGYKMETVSQLLCPTNSSSASAL
jgi:peptidoglycan/xylan/chitin deacetylase (PgdA/CDA1 family)